MARTMSARQSALLLAVALLLQLLVNAAAQRFPGAAAGAKTVLARERVESLYNARDFHRALLIYQRQLAPGGDKYAQYMVGYMHLTGRGTEPDKSAALAWYRLAAERKERPFVQARDELQASLDNAELQRADEVFAKLLPEFGDRQQLLQLIADDVRFLERQQAGQNSALASDFLGGQSIDHVALARERLRERIAWLGQLPGVPELVDAEEALREEIAAVQPLRNAPTNP